MAASAAVRQPVRRRRRRRARTPSAPGWAPSRRSGMFGALHWAALIEPAAGRRHVALAAHRPRGRRRADRAARARWPDWQRRTAAGVVAFVLLILALLIGRRAAAHARAGTGGTTSWPA